MTESGAGLTVGAGEAGAVPRIPNAVELVVAEQFADPALWTPSGQARMGVGNIAGLQRVSGDEIRRYKSNNRPDENWIALLYGTRVTSGEGYGRVAFETTSLETMAAIHDTLAKTVLAGEHTRPSTLVDSPVAKQRAMAVDPINNAFWLEQIIDGKWPIMSFDDGYLGEKEYFSHDYDDTHNALCALLPRETQDLITQVAQYESAWYKRYYAGAEPRKLALPGDTQHDNPFALGLDGTGRLENGIHLIDGVTGQETYLRLLHYLMNGEGANPEERLRAAEAYPPVIRDFHRSRIADAGDGLAGMQIYTAAMVNFVSRHRDGQNTTQEAVDAAFADFKVGAVRVAKKLLGEYDWAASDAQSAVIAAPEKKPSSLGDKARAVGRLSLKPLTSLFGRKPR